MIRCYLYHSGCDRPADFTIERKRLHTFVGFSALVETITELHVCLHHVSLATSAEWCVGYVLRPFKEGN